MVEKFKNIVITKENCEILRDEMIPVLSYYQLKEWDSLEGLCEPLTLGEVKEWMELSKIHNNILQMIEGEDVDKWE